MIASATDNTPIAVRNRRICFVYKEDYPWDVRVEKILRTLCSAGYETSLICRNNKKLPRRESKDGIKIHRLPVVPGVGSKINNLLSIPFYFNPFWLFWIWYYARKINPRVMVIRDLPLMPLGILVGKSLGIKIVFDMAECYPEMYASTLKFSDSKIGKFIFKNPGFARLMERFSFQNADHVFVMIEESRDRLLRLGADPSKVTIVSNTPDVSGSPSPRHHDDNSVLRLLYVGFITRIRGLDNALKGIRAFIDSGEDKVQIEFNVVGIGSAMAHYKNLCRKLDLDDNVVFHGWCSHEKVEDLYMKSDIGVLTYHVCSHWNHTIPNKLFDYMQAGMPVLATDVVPIKRIVESIDCGLVFSDYDAKACAECLTSLSDGDTRNRMAKRGTEAINSEFNWRTDLSRMLKVMEGLSS